MKFGKNLSKVIALSDPEWNPYWINYKFLKKKLKELLLDNQHGKVKAETKDSAPSALLQSSNEVLFFKFMHGELRKTVEFFTSMEHQLDLRRKRIQQGIAYLKQPGMVVEDGWTRAQESCISFYKELLLLENFAVMNYCGFSKILKKHDKYTGYVTRERFMKNVVNQQPFTHYPKVLEMLQDVERVFKELEIEVHGDEKMKEEERLFIGLLRGLNEEATSLQRQERAEFNATNSASSGSNSPTGSFQSPNRAFHTDHEEAKIFDKNLGLHDGQPVLKHEAVLGERENVGVTYANGTAKVTRRQKVRIEEDGLEVIKAPGKRARRK